ncbi:MAG: hypothetical protein CMF67_04120 [Magnetovibrio sp.]|nr:hypothetical protein [Magnetovibrio sp.]
MHSRLLIFRALYVVGLTIVFFGVASAAASPHRVAVLQGLDKVTARVSTLSAPIGATVRFGTLEIIVRYCDKRPPEETPESAAFIDIWQARRGEPAVSLFRGWMFASSPALNALEHPVYDIWVLDCEDSVEDADVSLRLQPYTPGIPALNLH